MYITPLALLALASAAPAQEPVSAADAAMQARVEVVNLLIANDTADDFFAQGVLARDRNDIAPALIAFLTAFRMDDGRFDAAFEIARLFTAWDEEDLGWTWLGRAVDAGYWSEQQLQRDQVLVPIRRRAGFDDLLERVRENYKAALPKLRGQTEVRRPEGEAPAGGWPMLLCLHGYGTDHHDLVNLAEVAASQGFVAVTVCGYQPISPGRHAWPNEGPKIHAYLQGVLEPYRDDATCNADVVYTTGFSQGGLVATYLVATHPGQFRGALPISPAGPLKVPAPKKGAAARPLFILYGSAEGAGVKGNVQRFEREFEQVGGSVKIENHAGGHAFPDDWREVVRRGLNFLRDADTSGSVVGDR